MKKTTILYWALSAIYLGILFSMANFSLSGTIEVRSVLFVTIPFLIVLGILVYRDKRTS